MKFVTIKDSLVSTQWLKENLSAENLVILDASIKPVTPATAVAQEPAYIPGSLRFDVDEEICDKTTSLPHMMPSPEDFTEKMQELGINQDSAIVAYDTVGIYSSPRAWWMFRTMGHRQVAVLDGGLAAWIQAGNKTATHLGAKPKERGNFVSHPQAGMIADSKYVLEALGDPSFSVIDARSAGRFTGQEPEPRAGLRSGHMPNAVNIPFADVLENGNMASPSNLRTIFEKYKNKKLIFSCGSGVTACVVALAAEQVGHKNLAVYDGSWSEWGIASSDLPVIKE